MYNTFVHTNEYEIGALFSEFLQTILMKAYFLGKDTSAYSRGINKVIDLI